MTTPTVRDQWLSSSGAQAARVMERILTDGIAEIDEVEDILVASKQTAADELMLETARTVRNWLESVRGIVYSAKRR